MKQELLTQNAMKFQWLKLHNLQLLVQFVQNSRKEDNPLTAMWRHNASSDYDEVVNWFVSHPQRDENKAKPKSDGTQVKTEDGGMPYSIFKVAFR